MYPRPPDYHAMDPDMKFAGYQTYYPFFRFTDEPDGEHDVYNSTGVCMNLAFVAKVRAPDGAMPIRFKCHWSETSPWHITP